MMSEINTMYGAALQFFLYPGQVAARFHFLMQKAPKQVSDTGVPEFVPRPGPYPVFLYEGVASLLICQD